MQYPAAKRAKTAEAEESVTRQVAQQALETSTENEHLRGSNIGSNVAASNSQQQEEQGTSQTNDFHGQKRKRGDGKHDEADDDDDTPTHMPKRQHSIPAKVRPMFRACRYNVEGQKFLAQDDNVTEVRYYLSLPENFLPRRRFECLCHGNRPCQCLITPSLILTSATADFTTCRIS